MSWFKATLASVVGTQEPEYGPSAIQSVKTQAETTPYTLLTKNDLKWKTLSSTNVETQTFYLLSDEGQVASLQILWNSVGGIRTTCQLNIKIWFHKGDSTNDHLWLSDPLENYGFDNDKVSFYADGVSVSLNEAGDEYAIKAARNDSALVDLVFKRNAPGFQVGNNGTSFFGTDPKNPWGEMRHRFWPRCLTSGKIITPNKTHDFKGRGVFVHALQGMKPHHAACKWNFLTFHTPTYSAVMMEFTTPQAYASTVVNVGGIVTDNEIVYAGASNTAKHTESRHDQETNWPEPLAVEYRWEGPSSSSSKNGDVTAVLKGPLGQRTDRVDVLSHVPGVIKSLVGGVAGTRPYIYQYGSPPTDKLVLSIKQGDKPTVEEKGTLFAEATYIS